MSDCLKVKTLLFQESLQNVKLLIPSTFVCMSDFKKVVFEKLIFQLKTGSNIIDHNLKKIDWSKKNYEQFIISAINIVTNKKCQHRSYVNSVYVLFIQLRNKKNKIKHWLQWESNLEPWHNSTTTYDIQPSHHLELSS